MLRDTETEAQREGYTEIHCEVFGWWALWEPSQDGKLAALPSSGELLESTVLDRLQIVLPPKQTMARALRQTAQELSCFL